VRNRIFVCGNCEFAGMLSMLLTMPSVVGVFYIAAAGFGVRPGDSDTAFVITFGAAGLINAVAIFVVVR
jgi:hypothetical protein